MIMANEFVRKVIAFADAIQPSHFFGGSECDEIIKKNFAKLVFPRRFTHLTRLYLMY